MHGNEVNLAFEILVEEIELVANRVHEEGARALLAGDYGLASRALEEARRLAEFREKVKALQKEWASFPAHKLQKRQTRTTSKGRLPPGLRTPEDAFRRPILQALVELGGKAPTSEVLELVGKKMADVLNEYDQERLESSPETPRWRNTAQWCRYTLVREGLMKDDSPVGIWEISEAGREWLEREREEGGQPL